jgi:ATP-dependent DNA ligase
MAQVEDSGTGVKSYVVDPSRPPRTKITYLTWTADGLLRHTVYVGLREDKPADEVRKETARAR